MMDPAIVETLAELVGLEFEDRHVERAVAQEDAVGERRVRPAHLLEVEGLFVELGHRFRVFGGDSNMTQLGHAVLLAFLTRTPYHERRVNPKRRITRRV